MTAKRTTNMGLRLPTEGPLDDVLPEIEERVLWLAMSIMQHADRVRPSRSGGPAGVHQTPSAAMVSIMTSLWFQQLQPGDRVSVTRQAAPLLHGIEFLLGQKNASYLMSPSELEDKRLTREPGAGDDAPFSIGLRTTAPVRGEIARRYVNTQLRDVGGRHFSVMVETDLADSAIRATITEPSFARLGEVVWVIGVDRLSAERGGPTPTTQAIEAMFGAAGWQVITVKFGRLLQHLFAKPGGALLRNRILDMSGAELQRLLRSGLTDLRLRLPGDGPESEMISAFLAEVDDLTLMRAIRDLGGHDMIALRAAYAQIADTQPTVILADTISGYGLPTEVQASTHPALNASQYEQWGRELGMDPEQPWAQFPENTPARYVCRWATERLALGQSRS